MTAAHGVALITGGGRGIGAACCHALAREGFRIAVHYRASEESARKLVETLGDAFLLQGDIARPEDCERMIRELEEQAGRLDVLVNNAGVNRNGPMVTMKLADYDAVAAIERGTWYLTKLALRRLLFRAARGRIITISSVVGHTGNPGQVPYTMTKAGLDAMTKSLAQELGPRGILVNAVAPGFIETEMTAELSADLRASILARIPLGRMGLAEEVADVVAFLATRGSYVQGTVIHVNGGMFGG